jgi:cytochrome c553
MNKKGFLIITTIGFIVLFASVALYAGSDVPAVIKMQNDYEHKKAIVEFSHAKHVTEYKGACGDCHHDENNKPLSNLKEGDAVKKCIECHSKPGEVPKAEKDKWKKEKLKKAEKDKLSRQWHAEAVHDNCRSCHKDYNKKNKTKAAPTTCVKCHPKKAK